MKKLRGIVAILAATALIFGTVACSDGGGNDNNNNNNPTQPSGSDPTGGSGTSDPVSGGGGSEGGDTEVSYCWNFQTTTTTEVKAVDAGGDYKGKYVLSEDYEYASTPSGMILTMGKGDAANGFVYNKIATDQTLGSSTVYYVNGSNTDSTAGATIGAIEPAGELVSLKNVQGPFTVKAYVQANGSSNKTDRYGYIKIGDEEFADASYKASTTLPAAGQVLTATYDSSDKVDVVIGCAKYMRIYDVVVTTAAAQDQSTAETNAGSITISADKTSAKVGSKVTWTLAANNMDVPSTVDIYVDSSSTPFITGAALTDGKYEMTVKEAWLETDEDDDPIETTVKVFVKSGDVSSNKVTITFEPADNIPLYSDGTPVNLVSDGYTAEELNYLFAMSDAEMETLVEGRYTDAACETPVTEGYEGDIYIKLNKTKDELKAMIDAAIAAATKYTVKFYINTTDTEPAYTVTDVVSGTPLTDAQLTAAKAALVKEDFTLAGLYTDKTLTTEFVETAGITGDTSVYAKWNAVVYFSSFDAGSDINKTDDSTDWEAFSATDDTWSVTNAKFQKSQTLVTADYDADAGTGYSYASRVKFKGTGKFTINTKAGKVLRIDGGNANGSDKRTVTITGADETTWEATTMGSFYLTATASTVVLGDASNEFCIYGIHVVDAKVATTSTTVATYSKPVVELSTDSCLKDAEVTITVTVPDAAVKTTYTDGKVVNSTTPVTETVTISGATVTDGKVDTSAAGTLTITASYTIGETAYTSDAVTLEVSASFAASTKTVTNDADTLGLVATSVESSDTDVATVALSDGIVITSVAAGTATITFTDGTNSGTIDVTVGAGGDITATVNKYSSVYTYTFDITKASAAGDFGATEDETFKFTIGGTSVSVSNGVIATGGKLQALNKTKCYVQFTIPEGANSAEVTVKYFSTNASRYPAVATADSPSTYIGNDDTVAQTDGSTSKTAETALSHTYTLSGAGTYVVGGAAAVSISGITVTVK